MNIPGIPTVQTMIESSYRATFNLKDPKYGLKGYNMTDTYQYEPIYKPAKIAINKLDKADHFTDI